MARTIRLFEPDTVVKVDNRRILTSAGHGLPELDGHGQFPIHMRDLRETAWVQWIGEPLPFGEGRARVMTLACAQCEARTTTRCCRVAWCTRHEALHRDTEHTRPDHGRYRAMVDAGADTVFRHAIGPEPVPGVLYPTDMSLLAMNTRGIANGIRIAEHVRRYTQLPGEQLDPIGDALATAAAGQGRFPTVAETQWLVYDIVARCTFPAILDALGHHDEARWMRRQPRVTSDATTPLVTHGDHWGLHSFGIDRATRAKVTITDAGQMAADDLFHPFFMQFKKGFGRGGFCFGTDESPEYLSYALSTPDGPERAGIGIARAHDDAVALVVSAFTTL